ncbi:MAG: arginine--tRNA ligase [Treponema sp.]|jgi:arginyl-tRNA synthetase|nr:arginine--tRNA ligase [Treponema sp.]
MVDFREYWQGKIAGALNMMMKEAGQTVEAAQVVVETPPKPELGDLGFPMFGYARLLRKAPAQIAQALAGALMEEQDLRGAVSAEGPYLNVKLDRGSAAGEILAALFNGEKRFGRPDTLAGSRIMVEFSSPNTNKPLHLGHLRNDALGESISRILAACGAEVRKVCIINNRGIHICKSMLAYQERGEGKTPESEGIKSDRFVGDYYVEFSRILAGEEAEKKAGTWPQGKVGAEERAQELLVKWEAGDPDTVALWKLMNGWTFRGMQETYTRTGISFDQYYYESGIYLLGKDEVLKGLEQGLFYRQEDGAVAVDLSAEGLDTKILIRKDGTSIYITQDIGLAINRNRDWPFDRLVYVVGSEQQYHFKVLFCILKKLGFEWTKNLYHLSYGMVNLPEGRMKSREGTVVDADDLIDSLKDMALLEIREKEREEAVGAPAEVAEKIAMGALHYFLLQVSPNRDMLFNPRESLSFTGNTGPYLQYMGARISALLRKAACGDSDAGDSSLLTGDAEWELLKVLAAYPESVAAAAAGMDPSFLTAYLYDLSKSFSRFYHDCPILNAEDRALSRARLALSRAVLRVLQDAFHLVCIPFLEAM